ncbi:hypothetical protein XF24_00811 [candidate division SR1 bacterium Aalborg_AAW-1]|nr:hypothetical protein XF24_00811 [candidate division SR1 bacterium Aalborg_AAW-1]
MKQFVIIYLLPSGTKLYHVDSCHTVSKDKKYAKRYSLDINSQEQTEKVKKHFREMWAIDSPIVEEYRENDIWEGYSIDQIQVNCESIDITTPQIIRTPIVIES